MVQRRVVGSGHAHPSSGRGLPLLFLRGRWGGTASRPRGPAKVWLSPVRVEYAYAFNPAELRRLRELAVENEAFFLERWNEYFGR